MPEEQRSAISVTRVGGEVAILTPVGIVVAYVVSQWQPDIPESVKQAIVGIVIAGGSMLMSYIRNREHKHAG